jgi:hypothetical protein
MLSSTLDFGRRRKEIISTEEEGVRHAVIPKQRGVVWILVMH